MNYNLSISGFYKEKNFMMLNSVTVLIVFIKNMVLCLLNSVKVYLKLKMKINECK